MATRAIIKVEGVNNCALYKHWDGYPSGTLPWLEKFNKEFTEKRGNDPSYKMAQLLRSSVKMAEEFGLDDSDFTGWGVVGRNDDMGQEFEYLLNADGTVTYKNAEP